LVVKMPKELSWPSSRPDRPWGRLRKSTLKKGIAAVFGQAMDVTLHHWKETNCVFPKHAIAD